MDFRVTKDHDLSVQFKSKDDAKALIGKIDKIDPDLGAKLDDRLTDKYATDDVKLTTLMFPDEAGKLISELLDKETHKGFWKQVFGK